MSNNSRRPLISGNWKMHQNHFEAIQCLQKLAYLVGKDDFEQVDVSLSVGGENSTHFCSCLVEETGVGIGPMTLASFDGSRAKMKNPLYCIYGWVK